MKTALVLLFLISFFSNAQYDNTYYSELENGITYLNGTKKLYPSVLGGHKIKKTGLAFLTFGIVPQESKPFLLFSKSSQKVDEQKFEFNFIKPVLNDLIVPEFDRYFRDAKSPKEFLLIKLEKNLRKDIRYVIKEKRGWGAKIIAKAIAFSFDEIEPGVFEVTPNTKLKKGEYCFVHQDILSSPNTKEFGFFDFSIE
jgi:hypothetical protein